ncbi:MAG: TonB-dependent receptor [Steroidobacteraceae bacterium]
MTRPIQMRALSLNPDEALPKTFDMDRVEILRGPQGTLFGAGSEGGTVRYITVQPSLSTNSVYGRAEVNYTQGGAPSYEAGTAAGGPLIDGKLGARVSVWYRRDGGWIDTTDPTTVDPTVTEKNANYSTTYLARLAALWAVNDNWTVTPSIYFQKKDQHNTDAFWVGSSNPGSNSFKNGDPTLRQLPDTFYLPALKIEGDFGAFRLISNTSVYHRQEQTGYDGTEYNLGFYQLYLPGAADVTGRPSIRSRRCRCLTVAEYICRRASRTTPRRRPSTITSRTSSRKCAWYRATRTPGWCGPPACSSRSTVKAIWSRSTIRCCSSSRRRSSARTTPDVFPYVDSDGNSFPTPADPAYPTDSYFLSTHATDKQFAWYGEATWSITDALKATVGLRESHMSFSLDSVTGGPQLYSPTIQQYVSNSENAFTPKVNLAWQVTPTDLLYGTYAKGFRPGGGNNPLPAIACGPDFATFGITSSPATYNSDHVDSFEIGAKDNFDNRLRIASSLYYIIWHDIQQTVLPPVCQITFITNLGQAVAKGADVQVEWAATSALSAELTAGYTDARYTRNASFPGVASPADGGPLPIANTGDAITGESGQPQCPVHGIRGAGISLQHHGARVIRTAGLGVPVASQVARAPAGIRIVPRAILTTFR